jgi:hypothetical protein
MDVLEVPMTISDVFSSDPINDTNFVQKVGIWANVVQRNTRNYAPTVLLVHPNRGYKRIAQEMFLDSLNEHHYLVPLEEFGAYWRNRIATTYQVEVRNDSLFVQFLTFNFDERISVIVEDDNQYLHLSFTDVNGNPIVFTRLPWDQNAGLYVTSHMSGIKDIEATEPEKHIKVWPNPNQGNFMLACPFCQNRWPFTISDMSGRVVHRSTTVTLQRVYISGLPAGRYVVSVEHPDGPVSEMMTVGQ